MTVLFSGDNYGNILSRGGLKRLDDRGFVVYGDPLETLYESQHVAPSPLCITKRILAVAQGPKGGPITVKSDQSTAWKASVPAA